MYDTDTIETGTLPEVPDFSSLPDRPQMAAWEDGWYKINFVPSQDITKRDGTVVTFESSDEPSRRGDSRNVSLRGTLTRKTDSETLNVGARINYRPDVDFSPETLAAIATARTNKQRLTGSELRSEIAVSQLTELQKIAGQKFQRNGNGGLDLTPIFGKTGYVRFGFPTVKEGEPAPKYREILDISATPPQGKRTVVHF